MLWGSLILVTLAVARVTRLITSDDISRPFRRWVIEKWGDDSQPAILVHCAWCAGAWISLPGAILWSFTMLPLHEWWLAAPTWFAIAYVVGLLSRLEGR